MRRSRLCSPWAPGIHCADIVGSRTLGASASKPGAQICFWERAARFVALFFARRLRCVELSTGRPLTVVNGRKSTLHGWQHFFFSGGLRPGCARMLPKFCQGPQGGDGTVSQVQRSTPHLGDVLQSSDPWPRLISLLPSVAQPGKGKIILLQASSPSSPHLERLGLQLVQRPSVVQ